MLKVGVIGLGAMGQNHVRLYSQMSSAGMALVDLVGVADSNPDRAREIGEKYHTQCYTDYLELLGKVEAVSVAVPTTLHHKIAMDFLAAGVHCLVEKPIASTVGEAGEMIKTAVNNRVKLAIGHIERFNPAVVKLKEIIDKGSLGQLLIISTRRVGPSVPRIRDVGIIIDSATHDIGVAKYLTGKEPVCVFSRAGSLKHIKEDHAVVVLDFESTTACIEVNWFTPNKVRTLVATGSEGIAYLDYIEQKVTVHNSQGAQNVEIQKTEPLKLEIEDFIESVIGNREPSVDGKEGLEVLKIALEASSNNCYTSQLILHK